MANLEVYRHNRVTRFTHWINAVALMILFMSGLMIFNAHPHLYWGSTSEPEKAFFSVGATNEDGDLRGYVRFYGRQLDTTGFLGVQQGALGPAPRAFPSWLTVPGYYSLASGRRWHFFFGWLFALNGLLYVVYNVVIGHMRKFFFTFDDAKKIPAMIAYYLHLRKNSPQEGEYNPLQKMAYTSVFVVLTPLVLLSGMAMSPQLDVAFNWLPAAFGGRQSARAIHFILAFGFLSFTFGHVFMVLTQGFINNMRSMITGWYRDKIPSHDEPPRPTGERRPDIARALKNEDASSQTNVPAPSAATAVEIEKAQAVPTVLPEASATTSSTEKEGEKDGEPKS
ncbi:MAG TPA: cytochrome b/b6 domain-containing protein [Candidatus Binatia bacterium]|jgi:Ni/Fe-hydrogenase b-type cytochrome subunit|nr:cytochrome b/b6 domain-containing protein [Candidatus Binatia bacterium]